MLSRPSAFVLKGVLTLILLGTALATSPRMAPQQNPQAISAATITRRIRAEAATEFRPGFSGRRTTRSSGKAGSAPKTLRRRRAGRVRGGPVRSVPAEDRSALRNVPESRIGREACRWRCAGSATLAVTRCLRAFPAAAANSTRCISGSTRTACSIASSPGIIAVSQSAFIPEPENGWYDVWIAYDPSYNVAPASSTRRSPKWSTCPGSIRSSGCCPTSRSTARSASRSTRPRSRSSSLTRRPDRAASKVRWMKTARRRACASIRSSPTADKARSRFRLRRADRIDTRPERGVSRVAADLPQRWIVCGSSGGYGQLPHHPRSLSLLELRECPVMAIESPGRKAGRSTRSGGAEGQLLHGGHPHRCVGREGRRAAEVLRARIVSFRRRATG